MFFGLVVWLFAELFVGLDIGLAAGSVIGPCVALLSAMKCGGKAVVMHYSLRFLLIRNGLTPWNYVWFLDNAAGLILLRKVGGGYAFIHRMLLEHFAARWVETWSEPGSSKVQPSSLGIGS